MPRQIEVPVEQDMRNKGYSPKAISEVTEELEDIEPGKHILELNNVIFIAVMPDESASIAGDNPLKRDNTQDVINGHNGIIEALQTSQQKDNILFKTQYLNSDTALNNWVPLDEAQPLTPANFKPDGATPLYDKALSLLSSVILETTQALERKQQARWGILLITDGDDTASKKRSAADVKLILDDMRKSGELLETCKPDDDATGSIALLGIEDRESDPGASTFFENVAASMGITWVLHANRANPTEMRRAFNTFSRPYLR